MLWPEFDSNRLGRKRQSLFGGNGESMNRKRLVLLAALLLLVGGAYAVTHWRDLRPAVVSTPAAVEEAGPVTTVGAAPTESASEAAAGPVIGEPSGTGASAGGDDAVAGGTFETRTKKEFDAAAADAAAEAETDGSASVPTGSASGKRSIAPSKVLASLDAVQLSATSASVIAGQAPSGTRITLLANDRELGTVVSDDTGAWTMIVEEPVPPGTYTLTLMAVAADGSDPVTRVVGEATVMAPEGTAVAEASEAGSTDQRADVPTTTAESGAATASSEGASTTDKELVAPSSKTFDVASVPPDATEEPDAAADAPTSVAGAEPAETGEAGASAEATTEADGANTTETTETAEVAETEPSLTDQAGAAAKSISEMFTDWLTATGEQAEEAAKSFAISAATYKPIAKGKGVVTLSGRGPPKAEVRLYVDRAAVGVTKIADSGRWLAEVDHWVEPGQHIARAEIVSVDGTVVAGQDLAFATAAAPQVVAASGSDGSETAEAAETNAILLAIADVAYESMGPKKGRITVSGRAEPKAPITVYADGKSIGTTAAADSGDWSLSSDTWIDVGAHAIRAERVASGGDVVESTLSEFVRPPAEAQVAANEASSDGDAAATSTTETSKPKRAKAAKSRKAKWRKQRQIYAMVVRGSEIARVRVALGKRRPQVLGQLRRGAPGWYRVRRGDTLWRIADRAYGDGRYYPVIYGRNRRAVANPDLIFPKQRLYVP
jgi:nucleoid-associated protein YgaU